MGSGASTDKKPHRSKAKSEVGVLFDDKAKLSRQAATEGPTNATVPWPAIGACSTTNAHWTRGNACFTT